MKTQIDINCPDCPSLKKNGIKSYGKKNYQCKDCKRQFIGDHALTYQGCHSKIENRIRLMTARGCGIRDIAVNERLEVDEFWTYVGRKKRKVWLIYAYDRDTSEIVAYVWGKRDLATARKLRSRLTVLKVGYGSISMDNWDSFLTAFKPDKK